MNKNPRNSGAAYLPERYKQQIEAKKRRRFLKKAAVICGIIVIAVLAYVMLSGTILSSVNQSPPLLHESAEPSPGASLIPSSGAYQTPLTRNMSDPIYPDIIIGTGIPTLPSSGILSLNDAILSLMKDYPEPAYTIIGVNLTDQYSNISLYEFRVRTTESLSTEPGFSAFIDASTGDPYIPGQESARISAAQAKNIVREVFHLTGSENIHIRYNSSPDSARAWIFLVQQDTRTIISGSLDPDTGQIMSFSRALSREGRPADPVLDNHTAQKIADRYIFNRNGAPLPVNMSAERYEPLGFPNESVAGQYVFVYNRIVQEIPCDYDGFTISVDSVTGDVTEYNRRWSSPDNAFSVASDPVVKRYEAILLVQQKALEISPSSASGLNIISAEIRWKDIHPPGSLPRPGSISVAWKVQFDDENIRAQQRPEPATGWVDARNGKILDFFYLY